MRCVIYSRVSTDEQNTDNQIKELTEYAKRQEWSVVDIISDVCSGGKSALKREGLKKVFQLSRQRKCDVILFWSLDRFSREGSRQTLNYLTKLDNYNVKWHSYTEEYISSLGVFADAIISLMACLAKQERIRISERTKAGLARIKQQGKNLGRPKTPDKIAKKAKELKMQGLSYSIIAKALNISKAGAYKLCNV